MAYCELSIVNWQFPFSEAKKEQTTTQPKLGDAGQVRHRKTEIGQHFGFYHFICLFMTHEPWPFHGASTSTFAKQKSFLAARTMSRRTCRVSRERVCRKWTAPVTVLQEGLITITDASIPSNITHCGLCAIYCQHNQQT